MIGLLLSVASSILLAQPAQDDDDDSAECVAPIPTADTDEDGVPDALDECPAQPETINGHLDYDGCPDQLPAQQTTEAKPPMVVEDDDTSRRVQFVVVESNSSDSIEQAADKLDQKTLQILQEVMKTDPELGEQMARELETLRKDKDDDSE